MLNRGKIKKYQKDAKNYQDKAIKIYQRTENKKGGSKNEL